MACSLLQHRPESPGITVMLNESAPRYTNEQLDRYHGLVTVFSVVELWKTQSHLLIIDE